MMRFVVPLFAAGFLSACSSGQHFVGSSPDLQTMPGTNLPQPLSSDVVATARAYHIGPLDKLTIDVFGIEDLTDRKIQVDSAGKLAIPLAGTFDAAGQTSSELALAIEQRLRSRYVRNPQVTVNVEDPKSLVFTVDGQVTKPGIYPVIGRLTLIGSVAAAGGTTRDAALQDVVIFRTVDGKKYAGIYNLKSIREGIYSDPEVYSGDVIEVGDSGGRRRFEELLAIGQALARR